MLAPAFDLPAWHRHSRGCFHTPANNPPGRASIYVQAIYARDPFRSPPGLWRHRNRSTSHPGRCRASKSAHRAAGGLMVRALWAWVGFLSLIMIVVAVRRIVHLSAPTVELDAGFARHARLNLAHILPGILFIALGP